MDQRGCSAVTAAGTACRMHPMRGEVFCASHHPENREAAQAARRLGGLRRRRERTITQSYEIAALAHADAEAIGRVAEIAILDALGLDNSVPRVRALLAGCSVLVKLRELSDLEERLTHLESALRIDRKEKNTT